LAYIVDRVVVCDAFQEPERHYRLLAGGRSKLVPGRRPSMRFLASAKDVKGGIAGVVGKEAGLFEDLLASSEQRNDVVIQLRDEVRAWREAGYPGTAGVTGRLLAWWFERDEERRATGKRFFFCQQEAVETVIYLYEVQGRRKMPETGEVLRHALKLATGTGKTVVMALIVTWSTLHKRKVSGSSLSSNFLVLVPNLTVRDRVSGVPRGKRSKRLTPGVNGLRAEPDGRTPRRRLRAAQRGLADARASLRRSERGARGRRSRAQRGEPRPRVYDATRSVAPRGTGGRDHSAPQLNHQINGWSTLISNTFVLWTPGRIFSGRW
jgi:hypothetical protein